MRTSAPRWAWACVAVWLALVTVGPLLPGLLGRDDPAGDSLVAAVLLSSSVPALVLGAVLAYRRAWPVLAAAVAGALGICPPAALLLAGLVRAGDGPDALGPVLLVAGVALVVCVLPLAFGASLGSTVRALRPDGSH